MGKSNVNPGAPQKITDYINNVGGEFREILIHLREILTSSEIGLEEDWKWGAPNFNSKGMVCWLASFKKHVGLNFFKGSLITDKYNLFEKQYEDRINRMIKYTALSEVDKGQLKYYLLEAMELNRQGKKPTPKKIVADFPEDFQNALNDNPKARDFFNSLAPSYKKEYLQWVATAKQEATRFKRLNTSIEWLSDGKKKSWKYEKC